MKLFYESTSLDPYENLAVEEYLMNTLPAGTCCLMLWQSGPSVIVGKNQNAAEEINRQFVQDNGIRIARRLTGGGAVYHDEGNLNYTVIEDLGRNDVDSASDRSSLQVGFDRYMEPVIRAMKEFGVSARITGRNDLVIGDKKVSGSAQYRRGVRNLHHSCILISSDLTALASSLRVNTEKYRSRGIPSVKSRVTTLSICAGHPVGVSEFKERLVTAFTEIFAGKTQAAVNMQNGIISRIELSSRDFENIRILKEQKYASYEWIYGRGDCCGVHRERRTEAGMIVVEMDVSRGRIDRIFFTGDFFGSGDVGRMEERLIGCSLDETLLEALRGFEISHYIKGVNAETLYSILTTEQ